MGEGVGPRKTEGMGSSKWQIRPGTCWIKWCCSAEIWRLVVIETGRFECSMKEIQRQTKVHIYIWISHIYIYIYTSYMNFRFITRLCRNYIMSTLMVPYSINTTSSFATFEISLGAKHKDGLWSCRIGSKYQCDNVKIKINNDKN